MCKGGANRTPWAGYRMGPSSTPKPGGVEKTPFQIAANQLEVVKNVNRTHLRTHWLATKWCNEQSYSFRQSPQMSKRRSSTICVVVERPVHHCGDDLVMIGLKEVWRGISRKGQEMERNSFGLKCYVGPPYRPVTPCSVSVAGCGRAEKK